VDSVIGADGDLKELKDIDVLIRSIYVALTTVKGTYPFNPAFGLGLHKYLFELSDDITLEYLTREVKNTVSTFEPRAVVKTDIYFSTNRKSIVIDMELEYNKETRKKKIVIDENIIKSGSER
jgi:phage baseplate assembly protein W